MTLRDSPRRWFDKWWGVSTRIRHGNTRVVEWLRTYCVADACDHAELTA
jgi:hypothetical protein